MVPQILPGSHAFVIKLLILEMFHFALLIQASVLSFDQPSTVPFRLILSLHFGHFSKRFVMSFQFYQFRQYLSVFFPLE